jgi:membrane-bound metal-dependent hydrolase YbcI (DUF457 family)
VLTALHFLTHIGLSWIVASLGRGTRTDRWLIVLAGVLPDLDGAGIVCSQDAYLALHRAAGHGLLFCLAMLAVTAWRAATPWKTAALTMLSAHLHFLLDVVGTGGLPIRYFWPFSQRGWSFSGHWVLASWPNVLVMMLTLVAVIVMARRTLRESRRRIHHAPGIRAGTG